MSVYKACFIYFRWRFGGGVGVEGGGYTTLLILCGSNRSHLKAPAVSSLPMHVSCTPIIVAVSDGFNEVSYAVFSSL